MGIDELKQEISESTRKQADALLEQARAQAKAIVDEARKEAKRIEAEGRKKSLAEAEKKKIEVYAAKLQARKITSEAEDAVVRKVFDEMRGQLESFADSKDYEKVLVKLAKQAVAELGGDAVLLVRKKDAALVKGVAKLSPKAIDCIGGVIAETQDARVRVDNTFEALLEEHADEIRQKVFEDFFPRGKSESKTKKK